jgi:tyrosyl-tRNA synthetase
MSGLWEDLSWRGLVHQVTDPALPGLLDQGGLTVYAGFDPTGPSLGVGNFQLIATLMRFERAGHRPIALAGGGTGVVGDPSGKSEERSLLDAHQLAANLAAIHGQLERFVDFDAGAVLLDNSEWLGDLRLLDFLRDVGKHFTVNAMMAKESVRARLEEREQGISYTEFSYMLLQAYDFLHLFEHHGCTVQIGGSDQWGNITLGIDLIRRRSSAVAYGLTSPLLLKADGAKFGKSESGNLWLAADMTSPYALYQHFIRTDDDVVGQYLRRLTFLSRDEIEALDAAIAERPERREAQRALARAITTLVHGPEETAAAERAAAVLFSEEIAGLDEPTLLAAFADAPSTVLSRSALSGAGLSVVEALVVAGLDKSNGAARRTVEQGGAYVNNRKVHGIDAAVTAADLLHNRYAILRRGRKDPHLLVFA